jgi:translocation and assembly module TamB
MAATKRSSAAISALLLAALAAFFLVPRLNDATSRAISEGIGALRSRLEGALGLTISFASLSPSILRSASFTGLSISGPGGRSILTARKVRVLYDLVAVLRGKGSEAITGLELEDVALDLRFPEDRALWDRFNALVGGGEGGAALPKMVVSGRNVVAAVGIEGLGTLSFDAREVSVSTAKDEPAISLDGRFSFADSGGALGPISGPLSLSGSISKDLRKARAELSVAALSREVSLSTQRFELVYDEGKLDLTKVKDRAPLDAEIRLDFGGGDSAVSLRLDGYAPAECLKLSGRYSSFMRWLEIPYKGSIDLAAPGFDASRLKYDISLAGSLPARIFAADSPALRAEIAAKGDGRSVTVSKAQAEWGANVLSYSGSFRFSDLSPDGKLDLDLSLMGGALGISSSVRLVGDGGEYAAMSDQASIGGVIFKDIALAAARKGSQADFNLSFRPPTASDAGADALPYGYSGEVGAEGGLSLVRGEGSVSLGANPSLELSLDLESIDLGPAKALLAIATDSPEAAAILASLKLGGTLFATSDFKRVSWSAPDLTVVSASVPGAYSLLSLSGTDKSLVVKRALLSASGYSVEGSGKVDFSEAGRIGFEASLSLKDIPYVMKGSVQGQGVSISGDYGLELSARTVGVDNYVTAKARGIPLPIGSGLFLATIDAEGRFASVDDWEATVAEFALVPTGESLTVLPKVELAGSFDPASAELGRLRIEDRLSAVSGKASLEYSFAKPLTAKLNARLAAEGNGKAQAAPESYALSASYSGGRVEGSIDMVASPLARLGKLPILGSVDGRIAVKGEVEAPSFDFKLKLRDGRYLGQSLALGASGSYGAQAIELRDLSAAYQGQAVSGGRASFSFADASAAASFSFAGNLVGETLQFNLSAQGATTMKPEAMRGAGLKELFASYAAKGMLSGLVVGKLRTENWPVSAIIDPAAIVVRGGSSGEILAKILPGNAFSASLRDPFPVKAELSGLYDGKSIDLSVQGLDFDLALLSPLMPPDLIKIVAGRARGGFRAIGLANDPEISGEIDLEGASVKVIGWLADEIGPFKAPIVAQGRKISVAVPSAKAGKAAVAVNCQATFDQWLPTGFTASVRTLERSRVALDAGLLGISAKGDAAADLRFALQGDILSIDCDVTLDKGTVVVSPAVLAQAAASGERPPLFIAVGAKVRFGRGVRVFFPYADYPVVAGNADPSSLLAIRYDQESEDFSLKGNVVLRGGEVFYIQRNFFLKTGKIAFNEDRNSFEPRVTILAELRDRIDEDGKQTPVLITLKADNAPISSFQPRLSSNPAMTESQIALLMGQNLIGVTADSRIDPLKVMSSGLEFIPGLNLTRALEDKVRDTLGLDILYLRSKVLQNLLIDVTGQVISPTPADASREDALSRYFDQSEIYAGKYLSDSIFSHASAALSIRYDPLYRSNKLGIDSELGVELDTPFGLIQWSIAPKSWDSLLINDQSLSLSWKLSF